MALRVCIMKYLNKIIPIFSVLVVGCSSVKTPAGPVCVSCKPYHCRGSWHYPQTYYEYDETGLASWYGDAFHGKAKASGEPFDKNAFTAAHRTLPIPSIVRVTNLRNGNSIVVLVDDRGPFVYDGRIIDLSYRSAKALDLHRYKPSKVRVECLVDESCKLSGYIAKNCRKKRDPLRRTWVQVYHQEIAKTQRVKCYTKPIEKRVVFTEKTIGFSKKHTISVKKQRKINKKPKGKMNKFLNSQKI